LSGTNFNLRANVDNETAAVTAQIVDDHGDTNVVAGQVERDGTLWAENLPLTGGTNTVTLTATDAAGNTSTTNFVVVQSDVTLTLDPVGTNQLNQLVTSVSGWVSDPSYDVWVNGVEVTNMDEYGNWNVDGVPINPGGAASFVATAFPAGSAPQTMFARPELNNGSPPPPPVQAGMDEDKPPYVYIEHYDLPDYHSQVGPYFWLRFEPVMEDLKLQWTFAGGGDLEYTNELSYGPPTGLLPGSTDDVWPVDAWPPTLDGEQVMNGGRSPATNSVGAPGFAMEQCDIQGTGYFYDDTVLLSAQYHRTANTEVRLSTGGRNFPGRNNLHALSVTLFQQAFHWWFGGGSLSYGTNIAPGATAGVFGPVDRNNMAYQALPDGQTVVATPLQAAVQQQGSPYLPVDNVITLQSLTVVSNSAVPIGGTNNWAAVMTATNDWVYVQATLSMADTNAANQIQWSAGEKVPGNPFAVRVTKTNDVETTVTATLGSTNLSLNVWIVWANLQINESGTLDPEDKASALIAGNPWPYYMGGGDSLGPDSVLSNPYITYCFAIGKIEAKATLEPTGIHNLMTNVWHMHRYVQFMAWTNGILAALNTNNFTRDDTSAGNFMCLISTNGDIFDLDAPGCPITGAIINHSAEVYDNFKEIVTVSLGNAELQCSNTNTWSYVSLVATNTVRTNVLSTSLIAL
jgi:hypothetical protein